MRLVTFVQNGGTRLGAVIEGEQVVDVAAAEQAIHGPTTSQDMMRDLIAGGPEAWGRLEMALERGSLAAFCRPSASVRLTAPLQPSKVCAIGLNYLDHVLEGGRKPPERPLLFAKLPSSVIGPGEAICWEPALSDKIDFEAELAVVIGRTAHRVAAADAYDYVFGYTCANDVTTRDLQDTDGQWTRAKSLDTFCPLGRGSSPATRSSSRTICPSAARSTVRRCSAHPPISLFSGSLSLSSSYRARSPCCPAT